MADKTAGDGVVSTEAGTAVPDWLWEVLLILPFVLTTVWLLFSHMEFNCFWSEDEHEFHFPLILEFVRQWPRFNFLYDQSATTPLLHLIAAALVKIGAKMTTLRVCNTMASAIGILYLRRFLLKERGLSPFSSTLAAAVLMFSFYYFGFAFRVLTDNLALIFFLLATGSLYRFLTRENGSLKPYLTGCIWLSCAILTRQSYVFLCPVFFAALFLRRNWQAKARVIGFGALCLALAPMLWLFILWKGFVPPAYQLRHTPGSFPVYPSSLVIPLCVLGFYAVAFRVPEIWAWLTTGWREWPRRKMLTAITVVITSIVFSFLLTADGTSAYTGILNTVANALPHFRGYGALTWLFLPAGLTVAIWKLLQGKWLRGDQPVEMITVLTIASLCLVSMANNVTTQKYSDGPILACLLMGLRPAQAGNRRWKFSMWVLIGTFCLYQIMRQASVWYVKP